jgi:hypothetical protein
VWVVYFSVETRAFKYLWAEHNRCSDNSASLHAYSLISLPQAWGPTSPSTGLKAEANLRYAAGFARVFWKPRVGLQLEFHIEAHSYMPTLLNFGISHKSRTGEHLYQCAIIPNGLYEMRDCNLKTQNGSQGYFIRLKAYSSRIWIQRLAEIFRHRRCWDARGYMSYGRRWVYLSLWNLVSFWIHAYGQITPRVGSPSYGSQTSNGLTRIKQKWC